MYQSTIPCPNCGYQNLRGTWVCSACGNTLVIYCHSCNAGNESGSQFCHNCGSPLIQSTQDPGSLQQQPQQPYNYQNENYPGYDQYQQPVSPYPAGNVPQGQLDGFAAKVKQSIVTINPMLFLMLGVVLMALAGFLAYAFQSGLIKTGQTAKPAGPSDKTPPVITRVEVTAGQGGSAILNWITDEYSSSQVQWGVYPAPNQMTPIQNDPTTGTNQGLLIHQAALTQLAAKTTYLYRVISVDKYGNKSVFPPGTSPPLEFQTTQYQ